MTDLTPEENQGGEAQSSFPTSTPSDSVEGQDDQPSLAVGAGGQGSSTTPEPEPEQGSGGVFLDASKVLLGLERDRLSPRRYSVDVECDSVTSDYSELGGTLKDIEKDVCFLDRDSLLNTYGVGEEGDDQYPLGPGFSLAQLGLRRDSSSSDLINNTTTPAEKQDNETEADFQKRLRKVSILSLAQEFALLKKVDSQACPIYFHRVNKSKSFRHSATPSPVSSRCQSVERTCRRTVSRSPHRSYDSGKRNQLTATAMDTAIQKPQQPPPSSSSSPASTTPSSKNHKGATNQTVQDLPTNEARRKHSSGSDDLPANMRPERRIIMQHQHENEEAISPTSPPPPSVQPSDSSATSSCLSQGHNNDDTTTTNNGVKPDSGEDNGDGGDGAFDVYNIENAMPANLDWKTLQQHMERHESDGKTRLQMCKNEREEIRRRLAMTDDDKENGDDNDDTDNNTHLTGSMLSNPRLQTSLEGAQNMQICFIPDDILDDDDDDDVTIGSHVINDVRGERTGSDDVISTSEDDTLSTENEASQPLPAANSSSSTPTSSTAPLSNRRPDPRHIASRQSQLQTEATLALAQASTMARMQLEVERQTKKKSPIADMVGIPTLGSGRRLRLSNAKLTDMNVAQLQVLVNDLHSQIELLNEDLVHLLIERDDLHMEQDSMLVDIEDLTSHCHDPKATNNNKTSLNNNRPGHRKDVRRH